jgi:CheY-like chemotaxis protein
VLVIRVTDTGIGMLPSELERIFDAFVQGDHADGGRANSFGGLGLGLAISSRIVELHHGQISAASDGRNRGCTFTIELPMVKVEPHATSVTIPVAHAGPNGRGEALAPLGSAFLSILLVEDHGPTRAALEALLKRRKHQVFAAGSVAEARALAEKETIDLVISDIGLPDGSGFELMAGLREQFGLKGIALTGYGMENDLIRSQEAGFVTHLMKPVRIQLLDEAIAALMTPLQGR